MVIGGVAYFSKRREGWWCSLGGKSLELRREAAMAAPASAVGKGQREKKGELLLC